MSALGLVALALLAQPASRPASAPAELGATAGDVYGELTMIFEVGEEAINTQESWRLDNRSPKAVAPELLTIRLPAGARKLRLDGDTKPFVALEDSSGIEAEGPLPPGEGSVSGAYQLPIDGSASTLRRPLPFRMGGVRLIMENIAGLELETNVRNTRRVKELNGLEFAIWDLDATPAGTELEIRLRGLPSRARWPRNLTVATMIGILVWMVVMLVRGRGETVAHHARLGTLSAAARRDRLVRAIELLDEQLAEDRIPADQHRRRHQTLLKDLAAVLRELDVEEKRTAGTA